MNWPLSSFASVYLALVLAVSAAFVPLAVWGTLSLVQLLSMFGLALIVTLLIAYYALRRISYSLASLRVGLLNFKDGDFSSQLVVSNNDALAGLCQLYNESADKLRQEKRWLYQRELLLDKVLQNTPEIMLLVNDSQQVVFSNYAARDFFHTGTAIEGQKLTALLKNIPARFASVLTESREGLFTLNRDSGEMETWHLSEGTFNLNNQHHRLFILKQMTRELSRQEVAVWKKVIRIISHELNNSIGPVSSMLHSGKLLSQHVDEPRLERVFSTISERIAHLRDFVQGYGKFAKLPAPVPHAVNLVNFINGLQLQWPFHYEQQGDGELIADQTQLEQLMINLLKNAWESDSDPDAISLSVTLGNTHTRIEVCDRGKGMTEPVLSQALIPFYSTKASGSGLGLALCREIVEAHNGQLALYNREEGGLCVRVTLPVL